VGVPKAQCRILDSVANELLAEFDASLGFTVLVEKIPAALFKLPGGAT
jgi:hypothetical protein